MRISDATIEKILKGAGKLSDTDFEPLKIEKKRTNRPLQELVVNHKVITEDDLISLYASYINTPLISLEPKSIAKEVVELIPERIARQYNAVVFAVDEDDTKRIAMEDPEDMQAVDFLQKYIGTRFKLFLASKESVLNGLESYREEITSELDKVIEVQKEENLSEQTFSEDDIAENSPIAKTVNLILEYAIRSDASDIHIEPRDDSVSIRYRVDGVLHESNSLPKNVHGALVSRIKILSNLKIDERRVPQDGRFKISINDKRYAFRVSTLPILAGEKVVMRILNESSQALTLKELGYWGRSLATLNEAVVQPHGMILVTGPTGSGKSTSLFSVLSILNSPSVNISTVEDPVEYKINGANQTQVNPAAGMTFAGGLRALLRQDPNIIMVGEIRDGETANLGVQAALTGHLVFSTLHTNNAATTLPRLLDMGIEPFLIASTVRAVVGQRLVRRLCSSCKESYAPEAQEVQSIMPLFGLSTAEAIARVHTLETQATSEGVGQDLEGLSSNETGFVRLFKEHSGGCEECHGSGYKGRIGIYEVLANSLDVQRMIVGNATSSVIQAQAIKEGMVTMQMDGLIKALRGQTSIEEILRVTRE